MKKTYTICTHERRPAECIDLTSNVIGIVQSGTLSIQHTGGTGIIQSGEVYILSRGRHYIQRTPTTESPFRELCLSFEDKEMTDALATLTSLCNIEIAMPASDDSNMHRNHAAAPLWPDMELFFASITPYIDTEYLNMRPELMRFKLAEFAYLVITHKEYGVQHKLLQCVDRMSNQFESIIRNSVFENLTIEEMSARTGCSLSSFKNDFQRVFGDTPHRWIVRQRLLHARLLVISTNKQIGEIAGDCRFDNVSHFIKLFNREFGKTPLVLRQQMR